MFHHRTSIGCALIVSVDEGQGLGGLSLGHDCFKSSALKLLYTIKTNKNTRIDILFFRYGIMGILESSCIPTSKHY